MARPGAWGRKDFFLYLPFQNIHAPYDASWEHVQRFAGRGLSLPQMTMFAYIYELDLAVGRVLAALAAAGLTNDSIVIAASDNGAPNAPGVEARNFPLRGFKAGTWEGGTRVPAVVYAPGRLPAGSTVDALVDGGHCAVRELGGSFSHHGGHFLRFT